VHAAATSAPADVRRSVATAATRSSSAVPTAAMASATARRGMNRGRHHNRQKDGGNACCKF
jgi:hypothetical protein